MRYSETLKEAALRRVFPPKSGPLAQAARDPGVTQQTMTAWKKRATADGVLFSDSELETDTWSSRDKFVVVLETSGMTERQPGEYARSKGLFVERLPNGAMPVRTLMMVLRVQVHHCIQESGHLRHSVRRLKRSLISRIVLWRC